LKTIGVAAVLPLAPRTLLAESDSKSAEARHRILTCNILLDLPEHKGKPEDWSAHRRELCIKVIQARTPDILCLQEVGPGQRDDFVKSFPGFTSFGYVDPHTDMRPPRFQGIKNMIMYSTERYEQTSAGLYWLSETPLIAGSKLAGEALPRHVSWLRLKDRVTRKEFRILNTHWALKQPVRAVEAQMLTSEAGPPYDPGFPQLLAGDFNSESTSPEHKILADAGWKDTYEILHKAVDSDSTAPAIPGAAHTTAPRRKIDFIYFHGNIKPLAAEIIREHEGDVYPSDHPFVSADVALQGQ
jgi:endonuclease/exonuclease/phosphatase family metal-dependent hydrolase